MIDINSTTTLLVHPQQLDIITPDRTYKLGTDTLQEPQRWASRLAPHVRTVKGLPGFSSPRPHPMTQTPTQPALPQQRQSQRQAPAQGGQGTRVRPDKRVSDSSQRQGRPTATGRAQQQHGVEGHIYGTGQTPTEQTEYYGDGAADVVFFGPSS